MMLCGIERMIVGLCQWFDLPPFPVGWSSGASLSGFDGPIEGLAHCALV